MGTGLLAFDEAWAGTEERAARFGTAPGTVVEAQCRPTRSRSVGAEPFIGEITMYGFNFPPRGWAHCDGRRAVVVWRPPFTLVPSGSPQ